MDKLPEKIVGNGIPYTLRGEYYLPNIVLSSSGDRPTGRWGWMHKKYLTEHRPVLCNHPVFIDGQRKVLSGNSDLLQTARCLVAALSSFVAKRLV